MNTKKDSEMEEKRQKAMVHNCKFNSEKSKKVM